MEEVGRVLVNGVGIHDGQPAHFAVGKCGDGADLAEEARGGDGEIFWIIALEKFGKKAAAGVDHGRQNGHGMGSRREALEMEQHVLMEKLGFGEHVGKLLEFPGSGQVPEDQQVSHLDERAVLGKFLDGEAAVAQDAFFPVDKSDCAFAGTGIGESGIHCDAAGFLAQLGKIDAALAFGPGNDGVVVGLAVYGEGGAWIHCIIIVLPPRACGERKISQWNRVANLNRGTAFRRRTDLQLDKRQP